MRWFRKDDNDTAAAAQLYAATVLAAAQVLSLGRRRALPRAEGDLIERECRRALELGVSMTLLELSIPNWGEILAMLPEPRQHETQEELLLLLRGTLRTTDLFLPQGEGVFLILLLGATSADAPTVVHNVRQAVHGYRLLAREGSSLFLRFTCRIATATLPEEGYTGAALRQLLAERRRDVPPEVNETEPNLRLIS